jgi:biotin operon repressor
MIPSHIYQRKDYTKTDQNLYGLLIALASTDGKAYATNQEMAGYLDVSVSTISKSLQTLKRDALITIDLGPHGNYRTITTVDTYLGSKIAQKRNKAPKTGDVVSPTYPKGKKVAPVPEWMDEFKQLLATST